MSEQEMADEIIDLLDLYLDKSLYSDWPDLREKLRLKMRAYRKVLQAAGKWEP